MQPIRRISAVSVSQIARVEVPAALWRKHRLGELDPDATRLLTADFEADYFGVAEELPRFAAIALTPRVLDEAARLCALHGLHAYDAIQLSSARLARDADPECTSVAAFDVSLRTAAALEGFALVPAGG
jgi:uncharacterized protein